MTCQPGQYHLLDPGMRSRSQGAGLFWSEPEPKKLASSGSGRGVDILTIFFGNLNFRFSKNFKISIFSKIDKFRIDFQTDQKIDENCITSNFF